MSNVITPSTRLRRAMHLRAPALVKRIIDTSGPAETLVRNVDLTDKSNTTMHLAARLGLPDVAAHLLALGHEDAGISRNVDGATPLMLAAAAGPDDDADPVAAARLAVARLLLDAHPQHAAIRDRAGRDAFAHAARAGTHSLLAAMLARPPPPPLLDLPLPAGTTHPLLDARDNDDCTPLHHACAFGHLKAVRVLVAAGADADARNAAMWTPVDYAASVAAEVYVRGLVRERDQLRGPALGLGRASPVPGRAVSPAVARRRGDSNDKTRAAGRPVGGVRLVPGEGSGTDDDGSEDGTTGAATPWQSRARART